VLEDRDENTDTRLQLLTPPPSIYTGYEEHITRTRISHLVFMEDTELIVKKKEEPQNQLKTPVSKSIRD